MRGDPIASVLLIAALACCDGPGAPADDASGNGGSGGSCAPPPECNTCDAGPVLGPDGCIVGWKCASGVDPCRPAACTTNKDCYYDRYCGPNGGCIAKPACTTYTSTSSSGDGGGPSSTYPVGDGTCTWDCENGRHFSAHCIVDADGGYCDCRSPEAGTERRYDSDCVGSRYGDPCYTGDRCCNFRW